MRFADEKPPGRNLTDEDKERFRRLQRMERRYSWEDFSERNPSPPSTFEPVGVLPFKNDGGACRTFQGLKKCGLGGHLACTQTSQNPYFTNETQIIVCVIPFINWLCQGRVPTTWNEVSVTAVLCCGILYPKSNQSGNLKCKSVIYLSRRQSCKQYVDRF